MTSREPFGAFPLPLDARALWRLATSARLSSGAKRRVRRLIRDRARYRGPFDVEAENMKFRLYPAENYDDRILVGRERLPEPEEHGWLEGRLRGGAFVDVGANVGTFSVFAGLRGAKVVAFEPHPRTVRKLRFNLDANGVDAVVEEAACGPEARMTLWSDGGGNVGGTSLLPEATSNARIAHDVAVRPLTGVLEEHGVTRIDALKIDVEGFEDRALAPFLDAAPDHLLPAAIVLEREHAHLWEADLDGALAARGYARRERTRLNELWERRVA